MNKKEYRTKLKEIRKKISNKNNKDLDIFFKCIDNEIFKQAKNVCLYFSLKNEVNCINLIDYCFKNNKNVYLPKITDDHNMVFIKITSLDNLIENNNFKVKEPVFNEDFVIKKEDIDIMFVPLLGYTLSKFRLGYGKGYYDNYLKDKDNIFTIGLGYKELSIEDDSIFKEFDIKLKEIIVI